MSYSTCSHGIIRWRAIDSERALQSDQLGSNPPLCHFPAVWRWVSSLTSQCFSFLFCKMSVIIVPISLGGCKGQISELLSYVSIRVWHIVSAPLILVIINIKSIDPRTTYVWFSPKFTNYSLLTLEKSCQTPEPQFSHLLSWDLKAYFREGHCECQIRWEGNT